MTVVDGYQAVGAIPVDVRELAIDVYIGGCLKWLCGGPGAAFVWVDPDHVRRMMKPKLTGWACRHLACRLPSKPELDRRADAWRFLHGTPSIRPSSPAGPILHDDYQLILQRICASRRQNHYRRPAARRRHAVTTPTTTPRQRRFTSGMATRFPRP